MRLGMVPFGDDPGFWAHGIAWYPMRGFPSVGWPARQRGCDTAVSSPRPTTPHGNREEGSNWMDGMALRWKWLIYDRV